MSLKRRKTNIPNDLHAQGQWAARLLNEQNELSGIACLIDDLRSYGAVFEEWSKESRRDFRGFRDLIADDLAIHGGIYDQLWKKSRKWMGGELAALDDSLTKRLERYATRPFPFPARRGVSIGHQLLKKNVRLIEARAFDMIVRLIDHDEFKRLRRCANAECRKWLFAGRRSDQRYCSTKCRQADFENNEERRQYNRERARKNYETKSGGPRRQYRRKYEHKL